LLKTVKIASLFVQLAVTSTQEMFGVPGRN